jgi:hypothetical protein
MKSFSQFLKENIEPTKTVKAYKLFRRGKDGNLYPLYVNNKEPVPMGKWLEAKSGPMTPEGKVKSKLGNLAFRPGWHSGNVPAAPHIGEKDAGATKPMYRASDHVWAEVEHPDDVDWQSRANAAAKKNKKGEIIPSTAHITDQVPYGGLYRYKTNPNMLGNWIISGNMKVNRVLSDNEVKSINDAAGVSDLPRRQQQ